MCAAGGTVNGAGNRLRPEGSSNRHSREWIYSCPGASSLAREASSAFHRDRFEQRRYCLVSFLHVGSRSFYRSHSSRSRCPQAVSCTTPPSPEDLLVCQVWWSIVTYKAPATDRGGQR